MAKFINIVIICILFIGCRKDKVELPTLLGEEYNFILGEWRWEISTISWDITNFASYSNPKFFVHRQQISEYCTLNFKNDGSLELKTVNGIEIKKLKAYGLIKLGENRVAHFLTDDGAQITLSYSPETNCLNTEFTFFTFPAHPCNTGFLILNSRYDKI